MTTLRELQDRLAHAQQRRTILKHLVEYIDESFIPTTTGPKLVLTGDDHLAIPPGAFEELLAGLLLPEVERLDTEIVSLLDSPMQAQETT